MEELGFMWHTESMDEVNLKLQYTTIELESVKMKANEQMMKHKEDMRKLLTLLQIACQERDEARDQLQKLLNKLMVATAPELHHVVAPPHQQKAANSSITESNSMTSLSDAYNHHSHISSPVVDSFFDAAAETSPEFSIADSSNMGIINHHHHHQQQHQPIVTKTDPATAVIDAIAKGKTLPEKGKFLQSVMESGPLLQTLLLAGPLPRWRNPPPPLQAFKLPPVSINGCDASANVIQSPNPTTTIPQTASYLQMSRGNPNLCSRSILNFSNSASASGLGTQIPVVKRQRI